MLLLNIFRSEIFIAKPQPLADLLVHRAYDFIKPRRASELLRHVLGDGLIVVEGDHHKFLRKHSQPAFSFRAVKNLYGMMWSKSVKMTKALEQVVADGESPSHDTWAKQSPATRTVDMNWWSTKVTMDVIGVAGLGREFNMMDNQEDPLLKVYEEFFEPTRRRFVYLLLTLLLGLKNVQRLPWNMNEWFLRMTRSLAELCRPLMQEKRDAINKGADEHFDVLSLLIKSNNFSDKELTDQLLTYLAAG
jgi:cytochrome P450